MVVLRSALRELSRAPLRQMSRSATGSSRGTTTQGVDDRAATATAAAHAADAADEPAGPVRRLVVGLGNPGAKFEQTRHNIGFEVLRHFAAHYAPAMAESVGAGGAALELRPNRKLDAQLAECSLAFRPEHDAERGSSRSQRERSPAPARYDLVDAVSERRRAKTAAAGGVPFPLVQVSLLLPTTFMNLSGGSVRKFADSRRLRLKRNPRAMSRMDELIIVCDDVALPWGECRLKHKGGDGGQNGLKDVAKRLGTSSFARLRVGVGPADGSKFPGALDKYVLGRFSGREREGTGAVLRHCCEVLRVYLHRGVDAASTVANGKRVDLPTSDTYY